MGYVVCAKDMQSMLIALTTTKIENVFYNWMWSIEKRDQLFLADLKKTNEHTFAINNRSFNN